MNNTTKIGDQIPYNVTLAFGKGIDKRYGTVIAIADRGEYKKILLDTGHEIFRAK